ncbi:low temperature requirement protein A [Cellulomonas citrea]|uniref:low temperature requirement protein A n=1 Tax=Cellulomonas citrea TaxID=1909423 RepID=UPI001356E466|nr:low temperature requirement protein A [Cellulomonas citrea]
MTPTHDLLRPRGHGAAPVSHVELFFDLVFVFAVTQLSHLLISHPGGHTLVQTAVLGAAVWVVWIDTAWVTNWLDPQRGPVMAGMLTAAGLSLLVAAAIPEAFGARGWLFAVPVVVIQVGRSALTAWAMAGRWPENSRNFVRIGIWSAAGAVFWIAGAAVGGDARLVLWAMAVAIELGGFRVMVWVPGLGRSRAETWDVHPEHLAERIGLFVIIALGESVVVTGATFAGAPLDAARIAAFAAAFASTVLAFLLFFERSQGRAAEYFAAQEHPGMVAQTAYTYVPLLLVAGVVLLAVADELVLLHPLGHAEPWTVGLVCGATGLYLLANALLRRATGGGWSWPHLIGVVVVLAGTAVGASTSPLALAWATNAVMLAVYLADGWRARSERLAGSRA